MSPLMMPSALADVPVASGAGFWPPSTSGAGSNRHGRRPACAPRPPHRAIGTTAPMRHRQADPMAQQTDMSSDAASSQGGSNFQPPAKNSGTCEPAHILFAASVLVFIGARISCGCFLAYFLGATEMTSFHGDFGTARVEAGNGLWHARIKRTNLKPLRTIGVGCRHQAIGFAGLDRTITTEDANSPINRFGSRAAR